MIGYYVAVVVVFFLFIIYDLNQIRGNKKFPRIFFPLGMILLIFTSVITAIYGRVWFELPIALKVIFWIMAAYSAAALIYTLFFAIPFDKAYVEGSKQKLCTTGVYSMCRHPGVLFMAATHLFAGMAIGKIEFLIVGTISTVCNIIYVIFQDAFFFPKLFKGYAEYRKTTPFLVPHPMRKTD